ncbi:hypothetical protein [Arthrobacter sp. NicSoilB4]|uniref:hypothetical protein n=1 Tax=Arthrobacter sp. NicSoilB4 TaxID=2830997 RepID=UPI001CC77E5B|nr:hypothetical protein [Arthrobacter sp. NicSoilB4]
MTIADPAPRRATDPGATDPGATDPGAGDDGDPAPEINGGRLNAPPFSWLGNDAWPNFPLWADKPS